MLKARIRQLISGLLILMTFCGCEQTTVTNVATADVFIKTIINEGDTLFGTAHSVVSFNRMSFVSVKSPAGDSIPLPGNVDGGISIYKNPSLSSDDYSKVLPLTGTYTYNVKFKDKSQQVFNNTLGADFLLPAVIDSLFKSSDGQSLVLKWSPVQGAQFYQIRVTTGNTEVIPAKLYSSTGGDEEVQFPIASFSQYMPGIFTFELDALLYESTNYLLLQAMSNSNGSISLP
jgi:hypothetical protein